MDGRFQTEGEVRVAAEADGHEPKPVASSSVTLWNLIGILLAMPPNCPLCTVEDLLDHSSHLECLTCGHEWKEESPAPTEETGPKERVVQDAYGNVLSDGDIVAMVKDLELKGSSKTLKKGMKSKGIRLVEGDHEIDCKMDGLAIALKAQFVKKVPQ